MNRFVEGIDRAQSTLFPECLEDWIGEDNPVRVIDAFVDALDLADLGFDGVEPEATGQLTDAELLSPLKHFDQRGSVAHRLNVVRVLGSLHRSLTV